MLGGDTIKLEMVIWGLCICVSIAGLGAGMIYFTPNVGRTELPREMDGFILGKTECSDVREEKPDYFLYVECDDGVVLSVSRVYENDQRSVNLAREGSNMSLDTACSAMRELHGPAFF